ncbi:MAG: serine protease [Planctomycetaceae bacterium]|nr:serine protease [Planctomycetaceae bacterium]
MIWLGHSPPAAVGQFPIRQVPSQWNTLRPVANSPAQPPAAASPQPLAGAAPAQQPHPAICRITVPEKDGISYGSGTLVDARGQFGLVVTNWHVVRSAAGTIVVEFPEGHKTAAHVVRTDPDWDLAALAVHRPKAEPLAISAEMPRMGEMLTIAGYGSGQYRAAAGPLSGLAAPRFGFPDEMLDLAAVEARQGDSGGPIINQRGEVCGVLFGSAPGYTIGSYGGRVRQFLATITPDGQLGSDAAAAVSGLAASATIKPPPANSLPATTPPIASDPSWIARADQTSPKIDVPPPPQATALHQSPRYAAGLIDLEKSEPLTPARSTRHDLIQAPVREWSGENESIDHKAAVDRLAANFPRLDHSHDGAAELAAGTRLHTSLPPRLGTGSAKGSGVDLNEAPPDQLLGAVWKRFGGTTLFDQTKAVLAIIGVLAVVVQVWRFGNRREEHGEDE